MKKTTTQQVIENIVSPFQRFLRIEASGGILLMVMTLVALFWANSKWQDLYVHFFHQTFVVGFSQYVLSYSLLHWINDALMVIFFFVVGLEIKREVLAGELSSFKQASLPIAAAVGGMLMPALIYSIITSSPPAQDGWGIPMATDIAFSLGVLSLLGKKVPLSLKIFLVAFAIVDDLGAILIIALFYSSQIYWHMLLIGLGLVIFLFVLNYLNIQTINLYVVTGFLIWYFFLKSGIHPTIAGVLIAFAIPSKRKINVMTFRRIIQRNLDPFCVDCEDEFRLNQAQMTSIESMEQHMKKVRSPAQTLEYSLHGFVTFFVMPLFALANAGVAIQGGAIEDFFRPVSFNIETSLLFGKVIGITLFSWLAVKFGISKLPATVKWVHIVGLGLLGGMGFTMSLFISNLAFRSGALLDEAKIGILVGSFIAGVLGYLLLRLTLKPKQVKD